LILKEKQEKSDGLHIMENSKKTFQKVTDTLFIASQLKHNDIWKDLLFVSKDF
jgi:hypothetical protein